MPEAEIAIAVQLLDLMLEFFADDVHWTRGSYNDGNGGHCLVGALLHLSRMHRLPAAPAIALLQDAMPRPGLPLVHFNDTCCGSVGELRLADAGFVVAAINHPGDTASDTSRSDDLSVFTERPNDIKRFIDFMIGTSSAAANIDPDRI